MARWTGPAAAAALLFLGCHPALEALDRAPEGLDRHRAVLETPSRDNARFALVLARERVQTCLDHVTTELEMLRAASAADPRGTLDRPYAFLEGECLRFSGSGRLYDDCFWLTTRIEKTLIEAALAIRHQVGVHPAIQDLFDAKTRLLGTNYRVCEHDTYLQALGVLGEKLEFIARLTDLARQKVGKDQRAVETTRPFLVLMGVKE